MNCDDVLQHLTSATRNEHDERLHQHIDGCRSCREMAHLFGPAIALFDASGSGDAPRSHDCPDGGDRWNEIWVATRVAERAAAHLKSSVPSSPATSRNWVIARVAAVLLFGVLIGRAVDRVADFSPFLSPAPGNEPESNGRNQPSTVSYPTGRCLHLLDQLQTTSQNCPTCEQPLPNRFNLVAVCNGCHLTPDSSSSGFPLTSLPRS